MIAGELVEQAQTYSAVTIVGNKRLPYQDIVGQQLRFPGSAAGQVVDAGKRGRACRMYQTLLCQVGVSPASAWRSCRCSTAQGLRRERLGPL